MRKFTLGFVLRQLPASLLYLTLGFVIGFYSGYFLFRLNKSFYESLLTVYSQRILLGVNFFGNNYALWYILNNMIALMLIIVAIILIIIYRSKTPTFLLSEKIKILQKYRPKMLLTGLYMIPVGVPMVNGFLVSFFITYTLLNFGFNRLVMALFLILPHGMNELLALLFASSLGLAYLKILSPFILQGKWNVCTRTGKQLLGSRVTIFVVILICILVIFGGLLEGYLSGIIHRLSLPI